MACFFYFRPALIIDVLEQRGWIRRASVHLVARLRATVAEAGYLLPDAEVVVFQGGGAVEDVGGSH